MPKITNMRRRCLYDGFDSCLDQFCRTLFPDGSTGVTDQIAYEQWKTKTGCVADIVCPSKVGLHGTYRRHANWCCQARSLPEGASTGYQDMSSLIRGCREDISAHRHRRRFGVHRLPMFYPRSKPKKVTARRLTPPRSLRGLGADDEGGFSWLSWQSGALVAGGAAIGAGVMFLFARGAVKK